VVRARQGGLQLTEARTDGRGVGGGGGGGGDSLSTLRGQPRRCVGQGAFDGGTTLGLDVECGAERAELAGDGLGLELERG
jgi:hypothetical protein